MKPLKNSTKCSSKGLGLIGFVLFEPEGGYILINLCDIEVCVHFWPLTRLGLFIRTEKSSFFL